MQGRERRGRGSAPTRIQLSLHLLLILDDLGKLARLLRVSSLHRLPEGIEVGVEAAQHLAVVDSRLLELAHRAQRLLVRRRRRITQQAELLVRVLAQLALRGDGRRSGGLDTLGDVEPLLFGGHHRALHLLAHRLQLLLEQRAAHVELKLDRLEHLGLRHAPSVEVRRELLRILAHFHLRRRSAARARRQRRQRHRRDGACSVSCGR